MAFPAARSPAKHLVPLATVVVGGILMAVMLASAFGWVLAGTHGKADLKVCLY